MKKLFALALVGVALFALGQRQAQAGTFCKKCCVQCFQYNAFSPVICGGGGGGCCSHRCAPKHNCQPPCEPEPCCPSHCEPEPCCPPDHCALGHLPSAETIAAMQNAAQMNQQAPIARPGYYPPYVLPVNYYPYGTWGQSYPYAQPAFAPVYGNVGR